MDQAMPAASTTPPTCLGTFWFDPLEDAVRGQVRAFIEQLLEEELEAALGRGRYERGTAAKGHRSGHRERRLDTTFGPTVLAVPRARLSWVRRTRFGGGLKDGTGAVPLNEESEAYALEVLDEDGDVALTVEGVTTPSHVLSEAELQAAMADGLAVALANPSFETGDLSGWTIESGSWSVDTDIAAGITKAADGSWFAYQSGLGSGAISQVADVSDYHLESGDAVTLTAFAADWTSSSDTAGLTIEAFDAGGAAVGSASSSTDLAAEDVWEQVSVELTLTGTPATIKITLAATHVSGGSQASIAFDAAELRVPFKIERPLSVRVYQINSAVGRGHPGSAIL